MIENNLKKISRYLKMRFPTTQISQDLGYSKGVVSEYFNNKKEISGNFRELFEKKYQIKFSDFEKDDESQNQYNNPEHMRELLNEKERTIRHMELSISILQDRIKDLERENLFSTQPLSERGEEGREKKAR